MNAAFSRDKFQELVLHVAELSETDPRFCAAKLNKLLYHMDFGAYRLLGEPIAGASYRRYPEGPVPTELEETRSALIDCGDARMEYRPHFLRTQDRIVPRRKANLNLFSGEELSIVRDVVDEFWTYNARSIGDYSRGEWGWKAAADLEDIPYHTAWVSGGPLTAEQVEKGRSIAARLTPAANG